MIEAEPFDTTLLTKSLFILIILYFLYSNAHDDVDVDVEVAGRPWRWVVDTEGCW